MPVIALCVFELKAISQLLLAHKVISCISARLSGSIRFRQPRACMLLRYNYRSFTSSVITHTCPHTHMHIRPALLIQRVCRPHERTSCSSDSPKRDSRRTSGTRKRRPRLIRGSSVFVARRPVTGGFWTASLRRSRGQSSCTAEEQARPQQPRLPTVPCP